MDNNIILSLKHFEKPDKDFVKDKDCLICLESVDTESLHKIVKLPCNCNNSVYHIKCIIRFLQSGINKNFCPHCKKEYDINQHNDQPINQVLPNEENNEEALIREIKEELEYTPINYLLLGVFEDDYSISNYYIEEVKENFETSIKIYEGKGGEWHQAKEVIGRDDTSLNTKNVMQEMIVKIEKSLK